MNTFIGRCTIDHLMPAGDNWDTLDVLSLSQHFCCKEVKLF